MKPLLRSVAAICLLLSIHALPDNIEDVKQLPQTKEPVVEAEESDPQARVERCITCTSVVKAKSPKTAALTQLPGATFHTQQSFQSCTSDKGCAGLKVKDGNVIERYGNADAFNAAAAADINNEFTFHSAAALADLLAAAAINPPFWWMNENSPFKAGAGGNFEKFSKSESSSFSSGANANLGAAALNLAANPFLNGDLSKTASTGGSFQSSSAYDSSYSASNNGEVDLSKNPFLNGGFKAGSGQVGLGGAFGAQAANSAFGASGFNAGKVGAGYIGSSPAPFAAIGSNVNLISQKANEFDFEQQQQTQQNIDEIFSNSGNVAAGLDVSGGELQQACAGQGYVCALKTQCANGVVIASYAAILQAKPKVSDVFTLQTFFLL